MKTIKKLFIALLSLTICISFIGCSNNSTADESTSATVASTNSTVVSTTSTTTQKATTTATSSTIASTTSKATKTTKKVTVGKSTTATKTTSKKSTTTKLAICYVTINCKSILDNMQDLKSGHEDYVPTSGYILKDYKCSYKSGDSAYDILSRACSENNIKLNAKNSVYGTYIVGINNIDEFDCGNESGWLYSVNGTQPNLSCSSYNVSSGDKIEFTYTCTYDY